MKRQKYNLIKYCRDCDCKLVLGMNWTKSKEDRSTYICSSCYAKLMREYRWKVNPNTGKQQVNNSIKHCRDCDCELIIEKNWTEASQDHSIYLCRDCHNKRMAIWRDTNPDYNNEYRQTPKGKVYIRKKNAKRRGYDSIELFDNPFEDDIPVVSHHISDGFVVYLPRSLHLSHYTGNDKQKHRGELKPYVEGIYNITYEFTNK